MTINSLFHTSACLCAHHWHNGLRATESLCHFEVYTCPCSIFFSREYIVNAGWGLRTRLMTCSMQHTLRSLLICLEKSILSFNCFLITSGWGEAQLFDMPHNILIATLALTLDEWHLVIYFILFFSCICCCYMQVCNILLKNSCSSVISI